MITVSIGKNRDRVMQWQLQINKNNQLALPMQQWNGSGGARHARILDCSVSFPMITIDFIGLLLTACLVGIRYPGSVLLAIITHEVGRILVALFFQGQIDSIIVSGVFSATSVSQLSPEAKLLLVAFGGPLANYILSSAVGGVEWESTKNLINPFAALRHPVAVINLRFAAASFFISILRLF